MGATVPGLSRIRSPGRLLPVMDHHGRPESANIGTGDAAELYPRANADIVFWYNGAAHHEDHMRDEDRDTVPVLWTGFELIPSNLFERTPFFEDPVP
jgi:hypothetical protein